VILIENFIIKEEIDWNFYPSLSSFEYKDMPDEIQDLVKYLNEKFSLWYSDDLYRENPFSYGWRFDVEENETDIRKIQDIIKHTNSLILKGKCYDILGIITNDSIYKLKAAENFLEYFINSAKVVEHNYSLIESLKRALFLLHSLKNRDEIKSWGIKIFNEIEYKDAEQKFVICFYYIKFIQRIEQSLLKDFISNIIAEVEKSTNIGEHHLETIQIIVNHYKSIKDENNIEKWKCIYSDYCEKLAEKTSPHGYSYLEKAIKMLDDGNHLEKVNDLRFLIDEQQRKIYDSMPMQSIMLNEKIINILEEKRKEIVDCFKKMPNGILQLIWFLKEFNALSIKVIEEEQKNKKKSIVNLVNHVVFDEDKIILYESAKATPAEKAEYETVSIYQLHHSIKHGILCRPFLDNLKMDEEFKNMLLDICSHNLFIPKNRTKIVFDILLEGLNRNIRKATFNLISQFEYGLREYLRVYKKQYPTIKKGSENYSIDLNNILVKKSKNEIFRRHIVEILGDDLTQEIEFLSCRSLGPNLRNRNYHDGYGDTDCYKIEEMILFFMILKVYCLGYDAEINI